MGYRFNRYPKGLLSYLDAQVGGASPQELESAVRGVFDLEKFYRVGSQEIKTGSTGVIGVGGAGSFFGMSGAMIPPNDEVWLVHEYTAYQVGTIGAGQNFNAYAAHTFSDPGGAQQPFLLTDFGTTITTTGRSPATRASEPFVHWGWGDIGAWVQTAEGAGLAVQLTGCIAFTRLRF